MSFEPLLPLDDLLVVELGDALAGAFAGKLLADVGARVVRVEQPGGGALYRSAPLVGEDQAGLAVGAAWLHLSRGKESVACRLDHPDGLAVLDGLLRRADVLIDGLGLDVLAGYGLPYAAIQEMFPGLVIAAVTPFGLTGPYRNLHASDLSVCALGGLLNMVGFPEREPLELGGAQVQYATGLSVYTGLMAAITYRDGSGRGQLVDVSMLESVAFAEWKSAAYYEADGRVRYRVGASSHWLVLEANDGYVALVYQDDSFPALQRLTDIDALNDERFATRVGRAQHAAEIRALLEPWFAERSKLAIYHAGQALGIPLGFVATIEDLLISPQYEARAFWQTVEHPYTGSAVFPGYPYHLSGIDLPVQQPPVLGEHTAAVLTSTLEFSAEQTAYLRMEGVI